MYGTTLRATKPQDINILAKIGYGYLCVMGIVNSINKLHYLTAENFRHGIYNKQCQCQTIDYLNM